MRLPQLLPTMRQVISVTTVGVILLGLGFCLVNDILTSIQIAFADEQTAIFEQMQRLTAESETVDVGYLDYALSYYPSGTKQTAGSAHGSRRRTGQAVRRPGDHRHSAFPNRQGLRRRPATLDRGLEKESPMFRTRVSIAGLMWAVFLSAVGLAALKSGTDAWSGSIFLLTCGTLAVGVVGVACNARARRWWVGFTVFGLGYLFLAFGFRLGRLELPPLATDQLIWWLGGS